MTRASGSGANVVRRPLLPLTVLAYFLFGPPVAGTLFLSILALGTMSLSQWVEALPPFIGITYVIAGLPALITAFAAAILSAATRWWVRLAAPALTALVTGFAAVWFIVRLGDPPQGTLLAATVISTVAGSLVPGLVLELLRPVLLKRHSDNSSATRADPPPNGG